MSYLFGDTGTAAARLGLLARVFEPASRAFLKAVAPPAIGLALDLGCGPGHTTALLAEVLRCRHAIGLDVSDGFVQMAGRLASDRVSFRVHDVTAVPFPVGPAHLLYCRLLLTHLRDPMQVVARWATQLTSGGLLLLEEVESIATNSPVLERYLAILDRVLRSQSNQLYVGPELERAESPPLLSKRISRAFELPVFPSDAAAMFAMNLRTWRDRESVREKVGEREIDRLGRDLEALRAHAPPGTGIVWKLRQIVYERD